LGFGLENTALWILMIFLFESMGNASFILIILPINQQLGHRSDTRLFFQFLHLFSSEIEWNWRRDFLVDSFHGGRVVMGLGTMTLEIAEMGFDLISNRGKAR